MISYISLLLLVLLALLIGIATYGELRLLDPNKRITSELPANTRAPVFTTTELGGGQAFDSSVLRGHNHLLLFISPECGLCRLLMTELPEPTPVPIVAICRGADTACTVFQSTSTVKLLLDANGEIADKYGVLRYPLAVAINARHRVRGYSVGNHYADLSTLLDHLHNPAATTAVDETEKTSV